MQRAREVRRWGAGRTGRTHAQRTQGWGGQLRAMRGVPSRGAAAALAAWPPCVLSCVLSCVRVEEEVGLSLAGSATRVSPRDARHHRVVVAEPAAGGCTHRRGRRGQRVGRCVGSGDAHVLARRLPAAAPPAARAAGSLAGPARPARPATPPCRPAPPSLRSPASRTSAVKCPLVAAGPWWHTTACRRYTPCTPPPGRRRCCCTASGASAAAAAAAAESAAVAAGPTSASSSTI